MTFTVSEIEEALDDLGFEGDEEDLEDFDGEGGWETVAYEWDDQTIHWLPIGDTKLAVQVLEVSTGTYDDDTYIILDVNGVNYRKFGWTASHDGTYWDGRLEKVESYEKTETYWRKI